MIQIQISKLQFGHKRMSNKVLGDLIAKVYSQNVINSVIFAQSILQKKRHHGNHVYRIRWYDAYGQNMQVNWQPQYIAEHVFHLRRTSKEAINVEQKTIMFTSDCQESRLLALCQDNYFFITCDLNEHEFLNSQSELKAKLTNYITKSINLNKQTNVKFYFETSGRQKKNLISIVSKKKKSQNLPFLVIQPQQNISIYKQQQEEKKNSEMEVESEVKNPNESIDNLKNKQTHKTEMVDENQQKHKNQKKNQKDDKQSTISKGYIFEITGHRLKQDKTPIFKLQTEGYNCQLPENFIFSPQLLKQLSLYKLSHGL